MHDIRALTRFVELLQRAGFGRGPFAFGSLLSYLQGEYDGNDVFRQFYLASIGLGRFSLKVPEIIDMAGPPVANDSDVRDKARIIWHQYRACEDPDLFSTKFKPGSMRLRLPARRAEQSVALETAMERLALAGIEPGTVWHMQWLVAHQEFIPRLWKDVLLKREGLIFFPRVALIERDEYVQCPYLKKEHAGSGISYSCVGFDGIALRRGIDYVACIERVEDSW